MSQRTPLLAAYLIYTSFSSLTALSLDFFITFLHIGIKERGHFFRHHLSTIIWAVA